MAFDWKKLNWTAIKIGILVTIITTYITQVLLPVSKGIIGPILGGLVAVYYAKTRDFKEVCMTGTLAGGIGSGIYYFVMTYLANALFGATYLAGFAFDIAGTDSHFWYLVVITGLIAGAVLGAIGGLLKWFYHAK